MFLADCDCFFCCAVITERKPDHCIMRFPGKIAADSVSKGMCTIDILEYAGNDGRPGKYREATIELSLFDMEADPYERENVIEKLPEAAKRMQAFANERSRQFYAQKVPE